MTRLLTALVGATLILGSPRSEAAAQHPAGEREIIGVTRGSRVVLTNMGGPRITRVGPTSLVSHLAASPYRQLIESISRNHGVDPQLTEAVIEVESAFNPNAVSTMGALGLMQLIPATGERFGVRNFFDPADNIRGGVQFLSFLIDKFRGNTDLVLAAYNSGENRVERLGRVPAIPETENYIRKVRRAWERLRGSPLVDEVLASSGSARDNTTEEGAARERSGSAIYGTMGAGGVVKFSNFGAGR